MKNLRIAIVSSLLFGALAASHGAARAQAAPPPPRAYGPAINLETARKVAAGAVAEATRNGWNLSIAVVDPAGQLVHFEKMDDSAGATVQVSMDKAKPSALFRGPTKRFQDGVAAGNVHLLLLAGAMPLEGGLPLVADGKVIGAIGVSGATGAQDGQVAKAGADLVK